nr:hypothetical protein [Kibdelosporangium sp. MJ126-NF4]CEL23649.1 hypothetical protein [Kibdelosporangium sp. MJ126-NF4]
MALLLTAGCGQSVTGTPVADPDGTRKAGEKAYSVAVQALNAYLQKTTDLRGSIYYYAAVNERKSGSDVDIAMRGTPAAFYYKSRSKTPPGYDYDTYHPASDPLEYVKLGQAYSSIAPTPWVSMPATEPGFTCAIAGLQTLCKINGALDATDKAKPPGRSTTATTAADGSTEVRTEITLKAFVDNSVINIPADVVGLIEPGLMNKLVPVKIVVNSDGTLHRAEVKGELQGSKTKVQIELGYESRGPADASDFPSVPQPGELTALPDKAAKDDFWDRMAKIRNN